MMPTDELYEWLEEEHIVVNDQLHIDPNTGLYYPKGEIISRAKKHFKKYSYRQIHEALITFNINFDQFRSLNFTIMLIEHHERFREYKKNGGELAYNQWAHTYLRK